MGEHSPRDRGSVWYLAPFMMYGILMLMGALMVSLILGELW